MAYTVRSSLVTSGILTEVYSLDQISFNVAKITVPIVRKPSTNIKIDIIADQPSQKNESLLTELAHVRRAGIIIFARQSAGTLPRKTTSTAQYLRICKRKNSISGRAKRTYAAAAPKISCLFALVNTERTAENNKVNTNKTPIHVAVPSLPRTRLLSLLTLTSL